MSVAKPPAPLFVRRQAPAGAAPAVASAGAAVASAGTGGEPLATDRPLAPPPSPRPARAASPPARLAAVLGGGAALFVALGLAGQWLERVVGVTRSFGFVFQFAPDEEGNLATWYASTLLLTCAALFGAVAWRAAGQRYRRHWAGLAVLLAFMSADESAQMHEMLIAPIRAVWNTGGVFHFAWVIPGIAFVACVALACAGFLRDLPPRTRRLFLAAAAVYLGGALGVEMIDGYYASRWGAATFQYGLLTSLEEGLELAGAVLLAYALADHLHRHPAGGTHGSPAPRA
jgi:hypothetical protein